MKKSFVTLVMALLISAIPTLIGSQELTDAREIVELHQDKMDLKGSESVARLLIYDKKGRLRERNLAMISSQSADGTDNTLMRFLAPADVKGTGFLIKDYETKDDDMWMYLPTLRKSRRIVSSEKSASFMGSEMTYSDISQFTIDDFKYKLTGSESIEGVACYVVEQTPANQRVANDYGFSKKTLYIGKEDLMARRSIYYNLDNEKWKMVNVLDLKPIAGLPDHKQALHIAVENLLNGRRSELIIDQFAYNENVKQEYFTIPSLEKP